MSVWVELSHVTLLVPSLEKSLAAFPSGLYRAGEIETFEEAVDGGTREVYVGPESYTKGMLLLVESATSRWFSRFAERFGYGLHHVAINVRSIVDYCEAMNEKGWFLHVGSALSLETLRTVYLVRPDVSLIIEVHQVAAERALGEHFVKSVVVDVDNAAQEEAILNLGIAELHPDRDAYSRFQIGERVWDVAAICRGENGSL